MFGFGRKKTPAWQIKAVMPSGCSAVFTLRVVADVNYMDDALSLAASKHNLPKPVVHAIQV